MKLTRRQVLVAAAAVQSSALIQNAAAQPAAADSAGDSRKQALDNVQRNQATLAKIKIPVSTEPAFRFQA